MSDVVKNNRIAVDKLASTGTPDGRPVAIPFGEYRELVELAERASDVPAVPESKFTDLKATDPKK